MAEKFSFGSEEPIDERNLNNPPKKAEGWLAKFRAKLEAKREAKAEAKAEGKAEAKRLAEEELKNNIKKW